MKQIKNKKLLNILLILANILLAIFIIKECKILGFCYTMLTLISPIFLGYGIAWLIKPLMFYFNKRFKLLTSSIITYILIAIFLSIICYLSIPIIVKEVKSLIPQILNIYKNLDPVILEKIDMNQIGSKVLSVINTYTVNIKDGILNIFYSVFISFFFLTNHKEVSKFFSKKVPSNLIYNVSVNLKAFVRGTLIDTVILFILSIVSFYIAKLPYAFLFALLISITNIIPYIGPYIGGVPSAIVAFNVSPHLGIIVLLIIVILQIVESSFIHPYIMSKSLKLNGVLIMISLIICGYFFGVVGMVLSTPILSILKTLYQYNKEFKFINLQLLDK